MNEQVGVQVALVSVGLGRVQRGFERWADDLFGLFCDHGTVHLTLYRSRQAHRLQERVPPLLWPLTHLLRVLPISAIAGREEYKRDCIAFALCLLPDLLRRRFDVIHIVDPPLAVALGQLRRLVPFRGRLLFTDGCATPPQYYPPVEHLHHVALAAYQDALSAAVPAARMTLIPSGLHTARFQQSASRAALRRKHGIADSTYVVLMVSAVKRAHKRVDHAIREASRLTGNLLLWIDGNPEDPEVPRLAEELLGPRCRLTHVPSSEVPELYHLADVLVHTSLTESFGLTIVEALCSGLPVLTHDNPHFRWLIEDADCVVDMSRPGALAVRLTEMRGTRAACAEQAGRRAVRVCARFDWHSLKAEYAEMYQDVAFQTNQDSIGPERPLLASARTATLSR